MLNNYAITFKYPTCLGGETQTMIMSADNDKEIEEEVAEYLEFYDATLISIDRTT